MTDSLRHSGHPTYSAGVECPDPRSDRGVIGHSTDCSDAPPTRSIWDGVYTDAQARRGEELYAKHCSRCHGADLAGLPWEALGKAMPEALRSYLHLDRTPELTGPTFYSNYDRLPLSDLAERIRISMPTGKPGILSRKDTVDVVAYSLSFGGFPLGRAELSDRLEDQRDIATVAYRP